MTRPRYGEFEWGPRDPAWADSHVGMRRHAPPASADSTFRRGAQGLGAPVSQARSDNRQVEPMTGRDSAKADLTSVCAALARLQVRLLDLHLAPSKYPRRLRDLQPPSLWLDAAPSDTALVGVISAVALAHAHLLAMIDAPGKVDPSAACNALQHIQCYSKRWGTMTLKLSKRLGYQLAGTPIEECGGKYLSMRRLPPARK